jgi:hypothetical protein
MGFAGIHTVDGFVGAKDGIEISFLVYDLEPVIFRG